MTKDNVVEFPGMTRHDIDPDDVLSAAVGELDFTVVVGATTDGENYLASSSTDMARIIFHLELAKSCLMRIASEETD